MINASPVSVCLNPESQATSLCENEYTADFHYNADAVDIARFGQFRHYIHFTSIDPTRNRYRFYTLTWQYGLWDEVSLVRNWGRIGGRGRSCSHIFDGRGIGYEVAARLIARRLRRGYTVADWQ
jgi:predicted DNA-binding WGR domain protein